MSIIIIVIVSISIIIISSIPLLGVFTITITLAIAADLFVFLETPVSASRRSPRTLWEGGRSGRKIAVESLRESPCKGAVVYCCCSYCYLSLPLLL